MLSSMEDQRNNQNPNTSNPNPVLENTERNEPVRSRWTPKPEQILILESIFNSGMVNPPKDETIKIRKLLEKFGSVGDANVFYWFQNRRSRSRRRQRQIQASLAGDHQVNSSYSSTQALAQALSSGFSSSSSSFGGLNANSSDFAGSSCNNMINDVGIDNSYISNHQMGFLDHMNNNNLDGNSYLCPSDPSNFQYQSGFITVLINGMPTEVQRGTLDMKAMFGEDVALIHSSGLPVPVNEYGLSLQSLQPGENYFLVSRSS